MITCLKIWLTISGSTPCEFKMFRNSESFLRRVSMVNRSPPLFFASLLKALDRMPLGLGTSLTPGRDSCSSMAFTIIGFSFFSKSFMMPWKSQIAMSLKIPRYSARSKFFRQCSFCFGVFWNWNAFFEVSMRL